MQQSDAGRQPAVAGFVSRGSVSHVGLAYSGLCVSGSHRWLAIQDVRSKRISGGQTDVDVHQGVMFSENASPDEALGRIDMRQNLSCRHRSIRLDSAQTRRLVSRYFRNLGGSVVNGQTDSSERVADSIVEPLDRWHADHRNFSRLLDLVQQEVDVFHQAGAQTTSCCARLSITCGTIRIASIIRARTWRSTAWSSTIQRYSSPVLDAYRNML